MDKDVNKYFNVSTGIPADELQTAIVSDPFIEVECKVSYRGKSNSYFKDRTSVRMIVDKNNRKIDGIWNNEWKEAAPGIETRGRDAFSTRRGRSEYYITESIRIHRKACPVYVKFLNTHEYIDYDGHYSNSHSTRYWIRYESEEG